jgi:hypothetical protein
MGDMVENAPPVVVFWPTTLAHWNQLSAVNDLAALRDSNHGRAEIDPDQVAGVWAIVTRLRCQLVAPNQFHRDGSRV